MNRNLKIIFSIPRTIWFNLRYLPFSQAIRLPIWIANNVRIKRLHRHSLKLTNPSLGLIRIGYHEADAVDCYSTHTIFDVEKGGTIHFMSDAHIGQGAIFCVKKTGLLTLGSNFAISGTTSIICANNISIGTDVQFSWNSLVMDTDAHHIYDKAGHKLSNISSVKIGDKVWIGANTTILKGAAIGSNSIIASNSLVNREFNENNIIIGGIPGKKIKEIGGWEI